MENNTSPGTPQNQFSGENLEVPAPVASPLGPQNASLNQVPGSQASPAIRLDNVLILIFVALVLVEWFLPEGGAVCRSCEGRSTVSGFLALPTFGMSIVAGVAFLGQTIRATKSASVGARIGAVAVGLCVGGFFVIIGVISALIGSFKGQPGT